MIEDENSPIIIYFFLKKKYFSFFSSLMLRNKDKNNNILPNGKVRLYDEKRANEPILFLSIYGLTRSCLLRFDQKIQGYHRISYSSILSLV